MNTVLIDTLKQISPMMSMIGIGLSIEFQGLKWIKENWWFAALVVAAGMLLSLCGIAFLSQFFIDNIFLYLLICIVVLFLGIGA